MARKTDQSKDIAPDKKPVMIFAGVLVLLSLLLAGGTLWQCKRSEESEIYEQLRLARSEGIPTTPEEYVATIPAVKLEENAAVEYKQLDKMIKEIQQVPTNLARDLIYKPTPEVITKAKTFLASNSKVLELIDRAAKKPNCWFDRPWLTELIVDHPELIAVLRTARLVLLRGQIAAAEGRPEELILAAREVIRIAEHVMQEPDSMPQLVGDSLRVSVVHGIAKCLAMHPESQILRDELNKLTKSKHKFNMEMATRHDLVFVKQVWDNIATPEGRKRLRLTAEDEIDDKVASTALSLMGSGLASAIKANRRMHASLKLPPEQMKAEMKASSDDAFAAVLTRPIALKVLVSVGNMYTYDPWQMAESRRVINVALARALSRYPFPTQIDTSDLLGPEDFKPVKYTFDGKTMKFSVTEMVTRDEKHEPDSSCSYELEVKH